MPVDINKGLSIVKKVLFVLPSLTFIHYSYARIINKIDNFSQETSIQSITDNTTTNRIIFGRDLNMAFKEVILKKVLTKNSQIEYVKSKNKEILDLNEELKSLEYKILNQKIKYIEISTELQYKCASSTEKQTSNIIRGYLSKARISSEAKQYLETLYLINKAIEIYNITNHSSYTLSFKIAGTKYWWFFANQDMEMKTNVGGKIYYLDVIDTNSSMGANGSLITTATFYVSGEIIDLIEQSGQIDCKIYFSQSNREREPSVFNIPANVIYEWKEIIKSK
ncbi:MAG: hypothetical protein NUV74_14420 [Candidatus Brocadiaceae bacterium]|nr:hypothetical protein [Candidatus Brocadiaceae bacterium]